MILELSMKQGGISLREIQGLIKESNELMKKLIPTVEIFREVIIEMLKHRNININENIIEIGKLDEAVSKYIDDYIFRKELKKGLQELKVKNDCKDILKFVIDYIINLFNRYKASNTRVIYISRWI